MTLNKNDTQKEYDSILDCLEQADLPSVSLYRNMGAVIPIK